MPGSSSWMPYASQGVKGFDDDERTSHDLSRIQQRTLRENCNSIRTKVLAGPIPTHEEPSRVPIQGT